MAYVIGNDCVACGTCIDECPVGAISAGDDKYSINPDMCTEVRHLRRCLPERGYQPSVRDTPKEKKGLPWQSFFCAQQEMSYSPFS